MYPVLDPSKSDRTPYEKCKHREVTGLYLVGNVRVVVIQDNGFWPP